MSNLRSRLTELHEQICSWPGLVADRRPELVDDCLTLVGLLEPGARVVDVGSGGGLPGLPLAVVRPDLQITLIEARARKTAFLVQAAARLGLANVAVLGMRAETAGRSPEHREAYDVAVARALAPMPVLAELCLPLVRVGGRLLAMKASAPAQLDIELVAAGAAIDSLGGGRAEVVATPSSARRHGVVVIVPKVTPTPAGYPRRPGVPGRRPLSAGGGPAR